MYIPITLVKSTTNNAASKLGVAGGVNMGFSVSDCVKSTINFIIINLEYYYKIFWQSLKD